MILPEYCYHIFDLYVRTIYRTLSPISHVLTITDQERAAKAKTVEEARACMQIDWDKLLRSQNRVKTSAQVRVVILGSWAER